MWVWLSGLLQWEGHVQTVFRILTATLRLDEASDAFSMLGVDKGSTASRTRIRLVLQMMLLVYQGRLTYVFGDLGILPAARFPRTLLTLILK